MRRGGEFNAVLADALLAENMAFRFKLRSGKIIEVRAFGTHLEHKIYYILGQSGTCLSYLKSTPY